MKELSGTAEATVSATAHECMRLFADVERYPEWYPEVIKRAEVTERDRAGRPTRARATVRVSAGPLRREFELLLGLEIRDNGVRLARLPHDRADPERLVIDWEVGAPPGTSIRLLLAARLEVPRLVPVGGLGDQLAQGFVAAARRALEGSHGLR